MTATKMREVPYGIELDGGEHWIVDNLNWKKAKKCWPRPMLKSMAIIAFSDCKIFLPIHEIINRIRDIDILLKFFDTLYSPNPTRTDYGRLELFLSANRGLTIKKFYGHLDTAGIALLPKTIKELGLAIGSTADAQAVFALQPWEGLCEMLVSLTPNVVLSDLQPLPEVKQHGIFFTDLTDNRVPFVVPAILALSPRRRLTGLYFPKSVLTFAGALHLAETIRDMGPLDITLNLTVEPYGDWKPTAEEKSKLEPIFKSKVLVSNFQWSMSWITLQLFNKLEVVT